MEYNKQCFMVKLYNKLPHMFKFLCYKIHVSPLPFLSTFPWSPHSPYTQALFLLLEAWVIFLPLKLQSRRLPGSFWNFPCVLLNWNIVFWTQKVVMEHSGGLLRDVCIINLFKDQQAWSVTVLKSSDPTWLTCWSLCWGGWFIISKPWNQLD